MIPDDTRYLVLDSETTGIGPLDKMVEIAWIEVDKDFNILNEHQTLLDPEYDISPSASGVHGLVQEDLNDSPTAEEFFSVDDPACLGHLIEYPVALIGHNIKFDERFVNPYITNIVQLTCTLRWARRLHPDAEDLKLATLNFSLGLPRSAGAHRAMADVMSAYHLARYVCDRTGMDLRQLTEASVAPMLVQRHSFGKHKGSAIADTPPSYLRWMSENIKDMDIDLRYSIDMALQNKKNK